MPYLGKNQNLIMEALEPGNLTMAELIDYCVPTHMELLRFDTAIGSLLRKGGIMCEKEGDTLIIMRKELIHLTAFDIRLLTCLLDEEGGEAQRERFIMKIMRLFGIGETGARMALSSLKKKEFLEFLNCPTRAVCITQAGIDALGGRNDVQT